MNFLLLVFTAVIAQVSVVIVVQFLSYIAGTNWQVLARTGFNSGGQCKYDYLHANVDGKYHEYKQLHNPWHSGSIKTHVTPTSGSTVQTDATTEYWFMDWFPSTTVTLTILDRNDQNETVYRDQPYQEVLCVSEDYFVMKKAMGSLEVVDRRGERLRTVCALTYKREVVNAVMNHDNNRVVVEVKELCGRERLYMVELDGRPVRELPLPSHCVLRASCDEFFVAVNSKTMKVVLFSWTRDHNCTVSKEVMGLGEGAIIADVACSYANGVPVLHLVVQERGSRRAKVVPYEIPQDIYCLFSNPSAAAEVANEESFA